MDIASSLAENDRRRFALALEAAAAAGEILMSHFRNPLEIRKKGRIDLVTQADLAAEGEIVQRIRHAFPDDSIFTEESHRSPSDSQNCWVIDPLDGTTNFSHGYPFFSVSIAYRSDGEEIIGVVNAPATQELFSAVRGGGAFLNGSPIACSSISSLQDAMLVTGFSYDISSACDLVFSRFRNVLLSCQAVRRDGSAALDICYVSAGRFDGFWEERLHPWDTAAGRVIAEEAGAKLSTFEGDNYSIFDDTILVSNGLLHSQIAEALHSHVRAQ